MIIKPYHKQLQVLQKASFHIQEKPEIRQNHLCLKYKNMSYLVFKTISLKLHHKFLNGACSNCREIYKKSFIIQLFRFFIRNMMAN